ncbi:unnamed protein product [Paramecium sonneborni]|uniref:Uncharacterized protein n=1 Tax=Paramecium sonneborni TaxID=65129 RepID=A0A8S1RBR7_9CILI|nr:unnamed protein product [Paramecium sonneborni]
MEIMKKVELELGNEEQEQFHKDPFLWESDEISQFLVHKKERKAHKNTHSFIQIMNRSKLSKFKSIYAYY